MNTFVLIGMTAALARPLQAFLWTRFVSMTLFREAFFWRLKRDLRKRAPRELAADDFADASPIAEPAEHEVTLR
jgi:hypothetical protein